MRRVYRQLFLPSRDGVKEQDLGIPIYGQTKALNDGVYDKLRLGLFGLGELEGNQPRCRSFQEEPAVSLAGHEILIAAARCFWQRAAPAASWSYPV